MNNEEIQQFVENHLKEELSGKEEILYQLVFESLAEEDTGMVLDINLMEEVITKIERQENKKDSIKHIFLIIVVLLSGICLFVAGVALIKVTLLFYIWGLLKTYSVIVFFALLSLTIVQISDFINKRQFLG